MKKIVLVFVGMLFGCILPAQNTNDILNNYLNVRNALVNSDNKATAQAVNTLLQSIKETGDFSQKKSLLKATEKMEKASSIEKQRSDFNEVSTIMWKVIKEAEKGNEPIYYQYCPMKKAYWLSKEKEIKNPYYGSSMINCGKVVEIKS